MTAAITPLRCPASPARWQSALRRAMDRNVQVRQLSGCGAWVASSGTDATTCYLVTETACECLAAQHGDDVCCHRALLLFRKNVLSLDPEPAPSAAPAVGLPKCWACRGTGEDFAEVGVGANARWIEIGCCVCQCTGVSADDACGEEVFDERDDEWAA